MKYLRRKGRWKNGESKYVIEENGKYLKTVPMVEELFELLSPDTLVAKQSQNMPEMATKADEKFGYELLSEHPKQDEIETLKKITEEQMKSLWELTK